MAPGNAPLRGPPRQTATGCRAGAAGATEEALSLELGRSRFCLWDPAYLSPTGHLGRGTRTLASQMVLVMGTEAQRGDFLAHTSFLTALWAQEHRNPGVASGPLHLFFYLPGAPLSQLLLAKRPEVVCARHFGPCLAPLKLPPPVAV